MAEDRTNPFLTKTSGKGDKGTRGKAEKATERADEEIKREERKVTPEQLDNGMIMAEMSAAELIPTGQYANVSIGPARLHFQIDPNRDIPEGGTYFSAAQRATIARALNEAAEMIEADVLAVQRNIVMESMQDQLGS